MHIGSRFAAHCNAKFIFICCCLEPRFTFTTLASGKSRRIIQVSRKQTCGFPSLPNPVYYFILSGILLNIRGRTYYHHVLGVYHKIYFCNK